jgi:GntR family transcriptional regulator
MTAAQIERLSPVPFHAQLRSILLGEIESGRLQPGERLPGEHELCERFGVSRTVVRQALGALEADGRLVRRKGLGTFVAAGKTPEALFERFSGLSEEVLGRGGTLHSRVLRLELEPATPELAELLEVPVGEPLVALERLRIVDDEPWVLTTTWVPHARAPGLLDEDFTQASLYALLEGRYGLLISHGRRSIEAVRASAPVARLLGVRRGDPLLLLRSTAYLEDGAPVEHFVAYHRSDRSAFEVTLPRRRPGR